MTHDYKEIWKEFAKRNGEQGFFAEAIRHALQLAQEAEQLRKERDELRGLILAITESPSGCWTEQQWEMAKKVRNENGNA